MMELSKREKINPVAGRLPLLMGVAMYGQFKLNPTPPGPVQAKVFAFMPVIMTVMFAWFPAGLVLYWLTNTLLSMAQQWKINKLVEAEDKEATDQLNNHRKGVHRMKTRFTGALAATLAAAILVAAPAALAKDEPPKATTMVTVYVSGHGGSELARKVGESHNKMEQQGWKFADMEVHTENGDTEGFWITYTK
jgi:hypothetical protein